MSIRDRILRFASRNVLAGVVATILSYALLGSLVVPRVVLS